MGLDTEIQNSATGAQVDTGHLKAQLRDASDPAKVGAIRFFSENDDGALTGTPALLSPETDPDYRLRVSTETLMESENFYFTGTNTGKYRVGTTAHAVTATPTGLTLNSGNSTAAGGSEISSYAFFPIYGSGFTYAEFTLSQSNQPVANGVLEAGLFLTGGAGNVAPTDGVFLRWQDTGMVAIATFNGVEEPLALPAVAYANNEVKKIQLVISNRRADFWLDNQLLGTLTCSPSRSTLCSAASLPWRVQYRQPGVASGVMQARLTNVTVAIGGITPTIDFDDVGNAAQGSYQGLSGMTMGSLANYANSANPAAAVPTNTTAALGSGLGGQFWETDTLAVTTDGIISSFQVPAGTIAIPGRRLVIKAVTIDSYIQTALTGGGYVAQWSIAFGHTSATLVTAEAATTKAPRRVVAGVHAVAAGAAAGVVLSRVSQIFTRPIVVNPGEFVQAVKKKVGTAPSAGVVAHAIHFDCGWV